MSDQQNRGSDLPSDVDLDHPYLQIVPPRHPQTQNFITTHNRNIAGSQQTPPRHIVSIQPHVPSHQDVDPVYSVHARPQRSEDCIPEKTPFREYRLEKNRLDTFKTWPKNAPVTKDNLARNGFIYLQTKDRVQCVFCRGVLSSWDPGDVVEEEHRKHCPECPFAFGFDNTNIPLTVNVIQQATVPRSIPEAAASQGRPQQVYNTIVKIPVSHSTNSLSSQNSLDENVLSSANRLDSRPMPSLPSGPSSVTPGAMVPATNIPKYPNWSDMNTRVKSFAQWPSQMNQKSQQLAEAGLIYLGSGDRCKCFWCGGELYEWEPEDEPWEEHAKWFTHCNYVRNIKGENFIQYVKDKQNGLNVVPPDVGNPHVLSVLQEGYTMEEVEEIFKLYGATHFLDARAIVEAIQMKRRERTAFRNQQNSRSHDLVVDSMDVEPSIERAPTQAVQAVSDEVTSTPSSHGSPSLRKKDDKDVDSVLLENEKLKDQKLCKICLDNELSITFFPCGHLATCEECSVTMTMCPICRKPIENKHRVFWS